MKRPNWTALSDQIESRGGNVCAGQGGVEDEGGKYSIGDSGEVRSRRKRKHGDDVGVDIDHSRPPSVWLAATSMASIDPRKIVGVCGALSALMKEWPQVRAVVNLHDGPSDGEPRGDPRRGIKLAEEFTLDNRITTTWITAPKVRFWMVLHPSTALMKNVDFVWLFDPHIAIHPTLNPVGMLNSVLRATEAQIVFAADVGNALEPTATPPPARSKRAGREAAAAAMAAATATATAATATTASWSHPLHCIAITSRLKASAPSVMFRTSAWALLLDRLEKPHPSKQVAMPNTTAAGVELLELICQMVSRTQNKPACVEVRLAILSCSGIAPSRSLCP